MSERGGIYGCLKEGGIDVSCYVLISRFRYSCMYGWMNGQRCIMNRGSFIHIYDPLLPRCGCTDTIILMTPSRFIPLAPTCIEVYTYRWMNG